MIGWVPLGQRVKQQFYIEVLRKFRERNEDLEKEWNCSKTESIQTNDIQYAKTIEKRHVCVTFPAVTLSLRENCVLQIKLASQY
ncbi:hypothetical protein TNCV_2196081 [Trichonephila clavipes]|nr:hypothetical protein TNCV_2196081 [Trichonephila clavipes]